MRAVFHAPFTLKEYDLASSGAYVLKFQDDKENTITFAFQEYEEYKEFLEMLAGIKR